MEATPFAHPRFALALFLAVALAIIRQFALVPFSDGRGNQSAIPLSKLERLFGLDLGSVLNMGRCNLVKPLGPLNLERGI